MTARQALMPVMHPVADSVDLLHGVDHAVLGAGELVDDGGNGLGVGGHRHVLIEDFPTLHQRRVLQVTVDPDALAQALGQDGLGFHVDELILQGGAAGVDNQNFHGSFFLSLVIFGKIR